MPLNMSKLTTIPIALTHGQAEALAAVAAGGGGNAATLAAWIIGEWVGRLPVEQTPPPTMAKAHQRLATLQAFWKARKTASAATAYEIIAARCLANGRKISRTALYEWEARWRESGLTGLIDRHKPTSKPLHQPRERASPGGPWPSNHNVLPPGETRIQGTGEYNPELQNHGSKHGAETSDCVKTTQFEAN